MNLDKEFLKRLLIERLTATNRYLVPDDMGADILAVMKTMKPHSFKLTFVIPSKRQLKKLKDIGVTDDTITIKLLESIENRILYNELNENESITNLELEIEDHQNDQIIKVSFISASFSS